MSKSSPSVEAPSRSVPTASASGGAPAARRGRRRRVEQRARHHAHRRGASARAQEAHEWAAAGSNGQWQTDQAQPAPRQALRLYPLDLARAAAAGSSNLRSRNTERIGPGSRIGQARESACTGSGPRHLRRRCSKTYSILMTELGCTCMKEPALAKAARLGCTSTLRPRRAVGACDGRIHAKAGPWRATSPHGGLARAEQLAVTCAQREPCGARAAREPGRARTRRCRTPAMQAGGAGCARSVKAGARASRAALGTLCLPGLRAFTRAPSFPLTSYPCPIGARSVLCSHLLSHLSEILHLLRAFASYLRDGRTAPPVDLIA